MATRVVEWDDFTGGYYVGPSATKQPRNTFTGDNVTVAMDDAAMIPAYEVNAFALNGTDVTSGVILNANLKGVGQPAMVLGVTAFTAKTLSAVYLYVITYSGAVVRFDISSNFGFLGTVANFVLGRPVMVARTDGNIEIYVPGAQNQIWRYTIDQNGTIIGSAAAVPVGGFSATANGQVYGLAVWGARMICWSNTSVLYFSSANDFSSGWPSANWIYIGWSQDPITAVVPRNYDLIVGKPSGWYSVSGVLDYSASVRQVNNGLGVMGDDPTCEFNNQVVFSTDTGTIAFPVNLYTVNGARVSPMAFQRFGGIPQNMTLAKCSVGTLAMCYTNDNDTSVDGFLWTLNQQGRWARSEISNATAAVTGNSVTYMPVSQVQSRGTGWFPDISILEWNATQKKIAFHYMEIATFEPGKNENGTASSATAKLADYMSQVPITVTDVYVEAEVVQLLASYNYTGNSAISCQVNMKYPPADLALSVGDVTSSNQTLSPVSGSTIPGTGTRFMGRVFRFRPDNPGYGYGFEVQINFSGMKVRRVMAVLKEQI